LIIKIKVQKLTDLSTSQVGIIHTLDMAAGFPVLMLTHSRLCKEFKIQLLQLSLIQKEQLLLEKWKSVAFVHMRTNTLQKSNKRHLLLG